MKDLAWQDSLQLAALVPVIAWTHLYRRVSQNGRQGEAAWIVYALEVCRNLSLVH